VRLTVHRSPEGGLWLDCQSELLSHLQTRIVIPLYPPDQFPSPIARLNPTVTFKGEPIVVGTQYVSAVALRELGPTEGVLEAERYVIGNALDLLLHGV
jgi:toxin CcdB